MNRTSVSTALTATGVGMTLLLAGCGSSGSGSAADSASTPMATGTSAASAGNGSQSAASSSAAAGASTTTSSGEKPAPSTDAAGSGAKTATAMPPNTKPSGKSSAGDKPVALCSVGQLRITVGGGDADMQGAHRSLRFTNVSDKVCKLIGAPGVSYVAGSQGNQVGKPAQRIVGHQPTVLIPNATASAGLFVSSAPSKSDCAKVTARGLRVYPPDSKKAAFVPMSEVTCASGGPYLKVGPILQGSDHTV
jgi:hypothetical protein